MKYAVIIAALLFLSACSCDEVCLMWEDGSPTGSKCIEWATHVSTTVSCGKNGCVPTTHTVTTCSAYGPCRKCLSWVDEDEAPPEGVPRVPPDRCR